MSELKDPKIKLFGKTIELPETYSAAAESGGPSSARPCESVGDDSSNQDPPCSSNSMLEDSNLNEQESGKSLPNPKEDNAKEDEIKDFNPTPPIIEDPKTEEDQDKTTLKKPDKILPCPRCSSMDTKFCYFNNYNVNQPRHFCKNCQRYWTAGGTMRNVPVGAGRRKHKNPIPQFQTRPEPCNPNGTTVLAFSSSSSSDSPLCESMASVLNIADKRKNGMVKPEENNGDDRSKGKNGSPQIIPNFHPWPYPWTYGPTSFPLQIYSTPPPPYWGCAIPGSWNIPWVIPPIPSTSGSGLGSPPTLGKHLRDDNNLKPSNTEVESIIAEKCLWVPKTLRIDDPEGSAKSSILATLGIKNDKSESVGGGGLFKAFRKKDGDEKSCVPEASTVLQANPAALSRSLSFHESS